MKKLLRVHTRFWGAEFLLVLAAGVTILAAPPDARQNGWPNWRGPFHNGMAASDAPSHWSDAENIKWKVAIPGKGHSSPVVWGGRIFLTTAVPTQTKAPSLRPRPQEGLAGPRPSLGGRGRGGRRGRSVSPVEHRFVVMCLDRKTGETIWEKTAAVATPHEGHHRRYGSFASHSPVTDGEHLIAYFGSRGVYCYDLDGNLVWKKTLGVDLRMRHSFGEGAAPALDGNMLFLKADQEGDSFLLALDKRTGKQIWRVARDEHSSWSAPLVVEHDGRKQVITSATKRVRSYDYETGRLIWECRGLGTNAIPAPVIHNGVVFVMTGHRSPNLLAIRLGGEGDITHSEFVLWSSTKGNAYTPSPVLHGNILYVLSDRGFVSAYNAMTGKPYYQQQRLPKSYAFKSSPVGANGKLYLSSEDGDVIVLKMGETYEVLATNTLAGQSFIATPAIVDGAMLLRSETGLFCIREQN